VSENVYRQVKWGLIGAGDFGLIYAQILKEQKKTPSGPPKHTE
jgi:hypothetical protein